MCVCSRLTRPAVSPSAAYGANRSSRRSFQPSGASAALMIGRTSSGRWCGTSPAELLCRRLFQAPEDFGHAPRLCHTSSGNVRLCGVEDLPDRSYARFIQMRLEPIEQPSRAGAIRGIHPEPGIDEGTDQPGPDGALVVGRVARAQIAVVLFLVVRMARRQ